MLASQWGWQTSWRLGVHAMAWLRNKGIFAISQQPRLAISSGRDNGWIFQGLTCENSETLSIVMCDKVADSTINQVTANIGVFQILKILPPGANKRYQLPFLVLWRWLTGFEAYQGLLLLLLFATRANRKICAPCVFVLRLFALLLLL